MAGTLEASGLGEEVDPGPFKSTDDMKGWCRESNKVLLQQLRECEQGVKMLEMAREDAKKGWLTQPQRIEAGGSVGRELFSVKVCMFSLCRRAIWEVFCCIRVLA